MRFGVLGPLAVWTDGGEPVRVPEAKVRALLADLLVHHGQPVSADRLAEDLWAGRPPGNPVNTLQTKVSQLRRALEAGQPGGRALVRRGPAGYLLRADALDLLEFRDLVARARTADPRARASLLGAALALWRGEPLADFADEPFAAPFARRLAEERLAAVEDRAEALLALGEQPDDLTAEVVRHPLRERLVGLHMRALYRAGRQVEALEAYTALRRALNEELGLSPSPELAALHESILKHEVGGRRVEAAWAGRPRTNLPAPVTELVGRADALREVRELLARSRLVTLTGPGGVGKTRLAVEVARGVPGTVLLVELAGADRAERVVAAVAAVLGVREDLPGAFDDLADWVAEALRARELLLVLDNCEQVVEPVAALVSRLLAAAPGLRVLATSREPLGLAAEALWAVPPLDVPGPDDDTGASGAVRLFVARARAAGFTPGPDDARTVAAVCRRLDGLPLALELAATRVRALGVAGLLERLDDRFRLLAGGHRDAPARQRTLRAVVDWSWDLLAERERVVLRRLSAHVDGCPLDAAEAVCAGPGVPADEVLDALDRLVNRSLVVADHGPGGPRYRLLESIAEYGRERLRQAGEQEAIRRGHAAFHLALAERADPELRGHRQLEWLRRLDADTANLRAALDVLDGDAAARLTRALTWYWFLRGRITEARRALRAAPGAEAAAWHAGFGVLAGEPVDQAAVDGASAIADPAARARAHWFLGYVLTTIGDMAAGERLTDLALAGFRRLGDRWGEAAALSDRVSQALTQGRLDVAHRSAEHSDRLFTELGDRWGRLQASFALGTLAQIGGDYERAARVHREGLRLAEELESWPEVSYTLSWLGRVSLLRGDHDRARDFHERARRLAAELGFGPGEVYAETGLALGARRRGDLDAAERHLLRVLRWHRSVGFAAGSTLALAELGFVAELRGDLDAARAWHAEGLALAREVGDPRAVALALEGTAGVRVLEGDPVEAARLLAEAAALRESVGVPLPAAERHDVDRITAAIHRLTPASASTTRPVPESG
ncbi:putative ATPase/DNA-binding SARP family transcriptional activator [Saccharothrix coeruleofusca]|uniref:BTAD domain-containing putative transcriptional regulator n=1 Tax=Saccharothrix coeruleofusca TaxID=33919 RepID=UPI001AE1B20B|nr:BTAD domain-containing putative transcriptional regulator [Saccharothrix coeruleofusca]MBP2339333.1 putative ATPase/DNA-binding SARP family transcriptional activator [Saccharothrix coeruleofusca]